MALQLRLTPRLQQRLVMTPALQMAIRLLQLNRLELEQTLQQEMVENPVLEDRNESPSDLEGDANAESEAEPQTDADEAVVDNLDVDSFFEQYFDYQPTSPNMREQFEAPPFENTLTATPSLSDHLLWQIEMTEVSALRLEICQAIVGNLDPNGYLRIGAAELAAMDDWDIDEVEGAMELVRELDPPGVGAVDLQDCLLLQLQRLDLEHDLATAVVRDGFAHLTAHRFREMARQLDADIESVAAAVELIKTLNPRPGQAYSDEIPRYIIPDVYVRRDGDVYRIVVNDDGLPKLRVSRLYHEMLSAGDSLPKETSAYLQEKLRSALWLIKSYGQRQRTIRKVAESIVAHQQDFLANGVGALRPMVLRDVADDIEMHESTVSRVVNGKYMHTAQGIYEMKYFFHSGLGHSSGNDVSSRSVKERIRKLIGGENAHKPLSDAAVAARLKIDGLSIARRTVAKYREELSIPSFQSAASDSLSLRLSGAISRPVAENRSSPSSEAGMNVEWIERGTKTPNHLRERAERHLGKLDRYSHGDSGARVVVTHEGAAGSALREVEVVLRNRLGVFAARDGLA